MFAYCLNNPVNASDPTGHSSSTDVNGNGIPDYLEKRWETLTYQTKYGKNIYNMMQFFGVSNPEEVPKLADGTMVFIEHVRSVSYNYFSEIRGHTIVMDNNKYCEYDFMGFGLGVSAIYFDSYVSGGYVFGVKNPEDYSGVFGGISANCIADGRGAAIAPNGVTAEIIKIYGDISFSAGASITYYTANSSNWVYGQAPIKWYNAWQSYYQPYNNTDGKL